MRSEEGDDADVNTPDPTGRTDDGQSPPPRVRSGSRSLTPGASVAARVGAAAAIVAAVVVVLVLVLGGGSSYTIHADFQDASGLVTGDNVLLGPTAVGTVSSISLTRNGQADVGMHVHGIGTLHGGTVARIQEDSLSGIASKYVSLQPGPSTNPAIQSGGTIGAQDTYAETNIDQLFDAFNGQTRKGLADLIRGEAASLRGKGAQANRTLQYFAPGLQSASNVTAELARNEPAFDGLLIQGAAAMKALASRSQQLSALIANTSTATGAIASQSRQLQEALALLPSTLTRSTHTFAGLDTTLASLNPVVAAAKPNVRQLAQFAQGLGAVSREGAPTITALDDLISSPNGGGDLTTLALSAPGLVAQADRAFPELIRNFSQSSAQLDYLREYTPDVVAALTNLGQAGSYYDGNGHYVRAAPMLYPFTVNSSNQLVQQNPADRYQGLQHTTSRCPGAAVQAAPDGSAPVSVPGCDTTQVPPGP